MNFDLFRKPGNRYRPLKIEHSFQFTDHAAWDFNDKKKVVDARLLELKQKGYGGLMTNVEYQDYLRSEENWTLFEYAVRQAIYQELRVWIYDEEGHPSGTAGGATLAENPEYQAKALAGRFCLVSPGEEVVVEKPEDCRAVTAVYALPLRDGEWSVADERFSTVPEDAAVDCVCGAPIELHSFLDEKGTLRWTAQERRFLVCYYTWSYFYEGSYAQYNSYASRRYLSVLNRDAVAAFLQNTYSRYQESVGDFFGRDVEAFFTEEPFLMASYSDPSIQPRQVRDPIREPGGGQHPRIVVWEPFLLDEFLLRYGYHLASVLHYLFAGTDARATKVRVQFYEMLSSLYEEAFFKQIGDFCLEHDIAFSGHLMREESLLQHALVEGDLFRFMGHLSIPGVDMMTTTPADILRQAAGPKLIASAAKWYGRRHVISQVSGDVEHWERQHFTVSEMMGAAGVQFALGVDLFASYYSDSYISPEDNVRFCAYTARLGEVFDGGRSSAAIGVYYPVESAWVTAKGSGKTLEERNFGEGGHICQESWQSILVSLLQNQLEFDCLSRVALTQLRPAGDGCVTGGAQQSRYRVLIVPRVVTLSDALVTGLEQAARAGTLVVFDSLSVSLPVLDMTEVEQKRRLCNLLASSSVVNSSSAAEIAEIVRNHLIPEAELVSDNPAVLCMSKEHTAFGFDRAYLFVNSASSPVHVDVLLKQNPVSAARLLDPATGLVKNLPIRFSADGRLLVHLSLDGFMSAVIGVTA